MSCNNCMSYRPTFRTNGVFTCPECGQQYKLAGVGPGNYWEKIDVIHPVPKQHIFRFEKYLAFIREHKCLICANPETVPHHEGLGKNAQGSKPPDSHAVPLCVSCHDRRHSHGVDTFWGGWDVKMHIIELLEEYIKEKI